MFFDVRGESWTLIMQCYNVTCKVNSTPLSSCQTLCSWKTYLDVKLRDDQVVVIYQITHLNGCKLKDVV